jgi:hypothetical protein
MTLVLYWLPVLLTGACVLLLDIYTDPALLSRWGREILSAHATKAAVYLGFGVLTYLGFAGATEAVGYAADTVAGVDVPLRGGPTGMTAGILAELSLGAYEWRRRK